MKDIFKLRKTIEKIISKHNIKDNKNVDILERYAILNEIEEKCGLLINDEIIISDKKLNADDFTDIIYNEIIKEKNK